MNMPHQDPYAAQSKRSLVTLGIGAGVVLALVLFGGGMFALGRLGGKKNNTLAVGSKSSNALPVIPQGNSALPAIANVEPSLPKPREAIKMPDEVYDWLEHLRKTEEMRKEVANNQISELVVMMAQMKTSSITDALKGLFTPDESPIPLDDNRPSKDSLVIDAQKKREEWQALKDYFLSYPAPSECVPIQASYTQALGETGAMIIEVLEAVEMASESPEKAIAALSKMQGTSGDRIDSMAKQTDNQVADICEKYETRKWFRIQGDIGGGFMSQLGGGF